MPQITTQKANNLCRLVLVRAGSILAFHDASGSHLPVVEFPAGSRPAEQIQNAVEDGWACQAIVLQICPRAVDSVSTAIVELRGNVSLEGMAIVELSDIDEDQLDDPTRMVAAMILSGSSKPGQPFLCLNWIQEAESWLRNQIGLDYRLPISVRQLNASGSFALVRFGVGDGKTFWMKATGEPNRHEFNLTGTLSEICADFLPTIIARREDWNAWLMEDSGVSPALWTEQTLKQAICSMAEMQIQTLGRSEELLTSGAGDLRVEVLRQAIPQIINYLSDAMSRQSSTRVSRIEDSRLTEIGCILSDCCFQMEALNIPDTLIHNDINSGNVLFRHGRCVFTDWAEAGVGNPFLTFQHMTLLQPVDSTDWIDGIRVAYSRCWYDHLDRSAADQAFDLAPPLAMLAYLHGRGDWLLSPRRHEPAFESYARTLARHMDRAAQAPRLLEALCH